MHDRAAEFPQDMFAETPAPKTAHAPKGSVRDLIMDAVATTGDAGMHIKEIASATEKEPGHIRTWLATGGKKELHLEAMGGGRYRLKPLTENTAAEVPAPQVVESVAPAPKPAPKPSLFEAIPLPKAKPKPAEEPEQAPKGLPLWTVRELLAYVPDDSEEIWPDGRLSMGERTVIVGAPGVGKSRLVLQSSICTILGWDFLGWKTQGTGLKWLFLQTENSARRLKFDLSAMMRNLSLADKERVNDCIRILNVNAMDFSSICMIGAHPDRMAIDATLKGWPADIVVVDPLRDAGNGDLNTDVVMTETCQGISSMVRKYNPKAVPLVLHHGRTGAAEASKVFGDDSASFGRNSKVLLGWTRSQINVAPAGVDHPDVVIVGCGKNSNGKKWEPFAAQLNEDTMFYERLSLEEFPLDAWETNMATEVAKRKKQKEDFPKEVLLDLLGAEQLTHGEMLERAERTKGSNGEFWKKPTFDRKWRDLKKFKLIEESKAEPGEWRAKQ